MAQIGSSPNKKKPPIILGILIAGVAVVVLAAGGLVFAASQESHDAFCASCHTQPESTFFQRSTGAQPSDLASVHTTYNTKCIDCHSGQGLQGRVQAEFLGAFNAAKWYSGTAAQPAVLLIPISNQNCLKCHPDVTSRSFSAKEQITVPGGRSGGGEGEGEGRNNHWHTFLARWQAASPGAGTCVSCHAGHSVDTTSQNGFMNAQNVQATCEACHKVLRRGDG